MKNSRIFKTESHRFSNHEWKYVKQQSKSSRSTMLLQHPPIMQLHSASDINVKFITYSLTIQREYSSNNQRTTNNRSTLIIGLHREATVRSHPRSTPVRTVGILSKTRRTKDIPKGGIKFLDINDDAVMRHWERDIEEEEEMYRFECGIFFFDCASLRNSSSTSGGHSTIVQAVRVLPTGGAEWSDWSAALANHSSSYCLRCIRWIMSRQSLKTRRMFSVSTAHVKWG